MEKLKKYVSSWIFFNLKYPKWILAALLGLTIVLGLGLNKLAFDPSIEFLMPKTEPVYLIGERVKAAFTNNKTLIISSIEPRKGIELFSKEVFEHLNNMVTEVEEYKTFNLNLETKRLDTLVGLGNATFSQPELKTSEPSKTKKPDSVEADLDKMILEGGEEKDLGKLIEKDSLDKSGEEIWDLNKPLSDKRYAIAIREKRTYAAENYTPVSLSKIRKSLDSIASGQVDTIFRTKGIEIDNEDRPLTKHEYLNLLSGWEDIYLFKSMQVVQAFMNPITGEDIVGTKDELKPIDFIETDKNGNRVLPKTPDDFRHYIEKITRNPMNKTILYSVDPNGKINALALSLVLRSLPEYTEIGEYLWSLLERYNHGVIEMYPYGSIVIEKFMGSFMAKDLKNFLPLVFLAAILTFYLNFRSIRGVLLPMLTVALAAVWTMGTMGHLGVKISLLVSVLPPLLIAIGSSYSIHMFNQYMMDLEKINVSDRIKGLKDSMGHIALTVFLAALTTFISFLTLTTNQVTSLRDFGTFAAIGAMFSMVISFVMIPAVLVLSRPLSTKKHEEEMRKNSWLESLLVWISRFTTQRAKIGAGISMAILIIGIFGLVRIKPETSPIFNFKDDSYIRKADERIGKLFHGTFSLNLVFDSGKKDGIYDPEFLNYVEGIRKWLDQDFQKEQYNILMTTTFSDFIKRMHMAMNSDNPEFYKIPEKEITIRDYMEILSGDDINSDGRIDAFEQFIDRDNRRVNLVFRTGTYGGRIYSTAISKKIRDNIFKHLETVENPHNYKVVFAGDAINFAVLADYIIHGQLQSIVLSLVVIALLVYFIFRSPMAAVVSIMPLGVAISMVYGMMGFAGIPLDIPKAILSSVAIGIGIDDTIHFMKTLAHHLQSNIPLKEAVRKTHEEAGLAIIYTSMALILGFSLLMLSNFKPVFYLGMLVSSVMLATTIGALVILPSIIVMLDLRIKNVNLDIDDK